MRRRGRRRGQGGEASGRACSTGIARRARLYTRGVSLAAVLRWVSLIGLSLLAFPLVPALVLLVNAETARGHVLGAAVVLGAVALALLPRAARIAGAWRWSAAAALAATAALATLGVTAEAPRSSARYASVHLAEPGSRWALGHLVPERDQVAVGVRLVQLVDRATTSTEAASIAELVLPLYRAMAEEPELEALGSALPQAYAQVWGQRFDEGHLFVARPPGERRPGRPALIFLHGSAGNFRSYVYALRALSAEHGWVVAHPSFGFGLWDRPGGVEAIERARDWLVTHEQVDPARVVLVGLSNGGLGASLAAAQHAEHYAGVGFISPVFDDRAVTSAAFTAGWRGRPVLVISGERDDRVPAAYVRTMARALATRGAQVTAHLYAEQDHFLWFRALDRGLADLGAWLDTIATATTPGE